MQIKITRKGKTETFEATSMHFDAFGLNFVDAKIKRTRVVEWRLFDSWKAEGKITKEMQERSEALHQNHIEND